MGIESESVDESEVVEALAASAAGGDAVALEELLRASQGRALAAARRFFPNDLDAEEAAQDALLSVSLNIGSFGGRAKYTTWLHRITTNASIDLYRKLKRHASDRLATGMDPPARGSSPSVRVGARIDLLDAAQQMDARLIESVLMRDLLELPYDEIADLHDVPEGTVRGRVSEGRKELRRLLVT